MILAACESACFVFLGARAKGDELRRQGTRDPSGSSCDRLLLTLWRSTGGVTGRGGRLGGGEGRTRIEEAVMVVRCWYAQVVAGSIMISSGSQDHVRVSEGLARSD